jgi:hypothetical protein
MTEVRRADRDRVARSAAPEAIVAHLERARAARSAAENEVDWLETLLARRLRQVSEGTWPPSRSEEADDGT